MLSYCLKCKTDTKSENSKVSKTNNDRIMLLSKCAVGNSKNQDLSKSSKQAGYSACGPFTKKKKKKEYKFDISIKPGTN